MSFRNYETTQAPDLCALLQAQARAFGERCFLTACDARGERRSLGFAGLWSAANAAGKTYFPNGLKNRRVVLCAGNSIAWVCAFFAVLCQGGSVAILGEHADAACIAEAARQTRASAVICACEKAPSDIPCIPPARFADIASLPAQACSDTPEMPTDRTFEADPSACAVILYPGTHKHPGRGVMLSHQSLCFTVSSVLQMVMLQPRDVFLSVLPMHHCFELTVGLLCPLAAGATVAYGTGLAGMMRDMRLFCPTVMLCVPTLAQTLYERAWAVLCRRGRRDAARRTVRASSMISLSAKRKLFSDVQAAWGGNLRLILSHGVTDAHIAAGLRDFGVLTLSGAGSPMCSSLFSLNRDTCRRDDSVGLTLPGTVLDIHLPREDGAGELRLRGENVMQGFWNDPEATAAVLHNGWLYTGMMGRIDPNGFLELPGEKKKVILRGARWGVIPEELEARLRQAALIKDARVLEEHGKITAILLPDHDAHAAQSADRGAVSLAPALARAVEEVNGSYPPELQIKAWRTTADPFPKNAAERLRRSAQNKKAKRISKIP